MYNICLNIDQLWRDARNISEMSLPYLKQYDRDYYNKLKPLVDKPMMLAIPYRKIDTNMQWVRTILYKNTFCHLSLF